MEVHNPSKDRIMYFKGNINVIFKKILSIFITIILITTVFSAISLAEYSEKDSAKEKIGNTAKKIVTNSINSLTNKISNRINNLITRFRENRKGIFSFRLVTKYQKEGSLDVIEKSTRMRLILPTAIDVDGDKDKDIRVFILRRPGIDLRPPALCWKTTLLIRRLPGMKDIKDDFLEVYLEYMPRILPKVTSGKVDRVRIGYQSPQGEEIPKFCTVTHKEIPRIIYPRKKTSHKIVINPFSIANKNQLNLLFSISDLKNDEGNSNLLIQVNHSPAVKNEIIFDRSKDKFIGRGQTLEIKRKSKGASNVSLVIKDSKEEEGGYVSINNIPTRITLSWFLGRKGYLKLNSYGSDVGNVEANVEGVIKIGFDPENKFRAKLGWFIPGFIKRRKGKGIDLNFETYVSSVLSDLYVEVPSFTFLGFLSPHKLKLTATLLGLDINADANVGNLVMKPALGVDKVEVNVSNANVILRNCVVDMEPIDTPTVTITSPTKGEEVEELVTISGSASAPVGREIYKVQVRIDDGDWVDADGTTDWSYTWETKDIANGEHKISARCFDGRFYSQDQIRVTVANPPPANWYPLVAFASPKDNVVLTGKITIQGTASDRDGTVTKVEIAIDNGKWMPAKGTTEWSFEWDAGVATSGTHSIHARCYDGQDYSPVASLDVFVKIKSEIVFTLNEASINVSNFQFNMLSDSIEVNQFKANGNGELQIAEDAASLEIDGELGIFDTSICVANESEETITLLENFTVEFNGYASLLLSDVIDLKIQDVSLSLSADSILDLGSCSIALDGTGDVELYFSHSPVTFNISMVTSSDLDINNLDFQWDDFIVKAAGIYGDGYVDFNFTIDNEEELMVGCGIKVFGLTIEGLVLAYQDFTYSKDKIDWDGEFTVDLSAEFNIEYSEDSVTIRIGGNGVATVWVNATFNVSGTKGGIQGLFNLETGDTPLWIHLYDLSGDMGVSIEGGALLNLTGFHLWYGDKLDIDIPSLISIAFNLNSSKDEGNMALTIKESTASLNINKLKLEPDIENLTLAGNLSLHLNRRADGTIKAEWDENGLIFDVDYTSNVEGDLKVHDFILRNDLVNVSLDTLDVSGNLDMVLVLKDKNMTLTSTGNFTDINLSNADIFVGSSAFTIDVQDISFFGEGSLDLEYKKENIKARAVFSGDSMMIINSLWGYAMQLGIGVDSIKIQGPTTITVMVNTSKEVPFTFNIDTNDAIQINSAYVSDLTEEYLQINELAGGEDAGSLTVGLNIKLGYPFIRVDGTWSVHELYIPKLSPGFMLSNLEINGSVSAEIMADIEYLTFIELRGEAYKSTSIKIKDYNFEIMISPGAFNLRLDQSGILNMINGNPLMNTGEHHLYFAGVFLNWVTIRYKDIDIIRAKGCIHFRFEHDAEETDEFTVFDAVADVKKLAGVFVFLDSIRFAGQGQGKLKFGGVRNSSHGVETFSDIYFDLTGEIDGVLQFKLNETSWIPILPEYTTDGCVVLLVNGKLNKDIEMKTPTGNTSARIEAWYAPPYDFENGGQTGQEYTYNFSYGVNGGYYEITTNKTQVFAPTFKYELGGPYTIMVNVSNDGNEVSDNTNVTVVEGNWMGISPGSTKKYEYHFDEVEEDGRFHNSFKIFNKADKAHPFTLYWEAFVDSHEGNRGHPPDEYWILWDMANWTFTPNNGTLNAGEKITVNYSFPPPIKHRDYVKNKESAWVFQDDFYVNGSDIKGNGWYKIMMFDGNVLLFPTDYIQLPSLEPGENYNSSFWLRNIGMDTLNWTVTEYPSNGNWTFTPNNGSIPAKGAQSIRVSLEAPDEPDKDLSGNITIENMDNESDYDSFHVYASTKQNQSTQDIVIFEDENNVSIRIGGKNIIRLTNFTFKINKISGLINGNWTFDIVNNKSYVWINWTKGSFFDTFSIQGSVNYSIEQFRFVYGENVSINISRVITGAFNFREGRRGNFTLAVDHTFTDVDIDLYMGYANLTLKGDLDVNISNNGSGILWIDWDFTGEKPNISFGGNLTRDGSFEFALTDFVFERDKFFSAVGEYMDYIILSADEISFAGSGGTIQVSDGYINISSDIDKLTVDDLCIEINANAVPLLGGSLQLSGEFNLETQVDGAFVLITWKENDYLQLVADSGVTLDLEDIYISWVTNESELIISCSSLNISAGVSPTLVTYANITNTLIINASAGATFELFSFHMDYSGSALGITLLNSTLDIPEFNFYVDLAVEGQIHMVINLTTKDNTSGGSGGGSGNNNTKIYEDIHLYLKAKNITLSGTGNIYVSAVSQDHFNISGHTPENINIAVEKFDLSFTKNITTRIGEIVGIDRIQIDGGFNSLDASLSGDFSINISVKNDSSSLYGNVAGNVEIHKIYLRFYFGVNLLNGVQLNINSFIVDNVSGTFYFNSAKSTEEINYTEFSFNSITTDSEAYIAVDDISLLGPLFNFNLTHWFVNGSGDIYCERYELDSTGDHIYLKLRSQNGFNGSFKRVGPLFGIRTKLRQLILGPGMLVIKRNLTNDGYILIDTGLDSFNIDGSIETYILGFKIRTKFRKLDIEADRFCLQWDQIFPPKKIRKTGKIKINPLGILEIDVANDPDGDGQYTWYDLPIPPTADFTYSKKDLTLYVNATESFDPDGDIEHYYWKWADWYPYVEGTAIDSFTYLFHGYKTVKLKVVDNDGKNDILTKNIYL